MQESLTLQLAGQPVSLLPTLGAAVELNKRHGGLMNLLAALDRYDLNAAVDVVLAARGLPEARRPDTAEAVFTEGLAMLTPTLVRFVILLAHGGRAPSERDEEAKEEQRPFA